MSQEVLAVPAKFNFGSDIVCKTVVFNQPNLIWCSVSDAQFICFLNFHFLTQNLTLNRVQTHSAVINSAVLYQY